jgi:hypothetical protein
MALDGLCVPDKAPWYASFRSELLSFPAGKHNDQVDALGLVGQLLDRMLAGRRPKADKPNKEINPFNQRLDPQVWRVGPPARASGQKRIKL